MPSYLIFDSDRKDEFADQEGGHKGRGLDERELRALPRLQPHQGVVPARGQVPAAPHHRHFRGAVPGKAPQRSAGMLVGLL